MKEMMEARVFMGHKVGTLNPNMNQYLFGERLGVCIIDLDKTVHHLKVALNFLAHLAYRGGIIVFVTNDRWLVHDVEKGARECGEYSHCHDFRRGTFTNFLRAYGNEVRLPDALVFMSTMSSPLKEHLAVHEAAKMQISTVGIVDSNCNPNLITYPIPGNDDSKQSIKFFMEKFKKAIILGKLKRQEHFGVDVNLNDES